MGPGNIAGIAHARTATISVAFSGSRIYELALAPTEYGFQGLRILCVIEVAKDDQVNGRVRCEALLNDVAQEFRLFKTQLRFISRPHRTLGFEMAANECE